MNRDQPFRLRSATEADAAALGRLHVAAWKETYTGLMPAPVLAALSVASRTRQWRRILGDPISFDDTRVFLAERPDGPAGFAACARQSDTRLAEQGFTGEFSAIYVLRRAQRLGIGDALMRRMAADLHARGLPGAALWVLAGNHHARRFYRQRGGKLVGRREDVRAGVRMTDLAYGWRDLTPLLALPLRGAGR